MVDAGPGSGRIGSRVMTNSADRLLPHPDAGWYDRTIGTSGLEYFHRATPEQRREQKCAGSEGTTPPEPATALVVDRQGRYHPDHDRRLGRGRLGGRPHW